MAPVAYRTARLAQSTLRIEGELELYQRSGGENAAIHLVEAPILVEIHATTCQSAPGLAARRGPQGSSQGSTGIRWAALKPWFSGCISMTFAADPSQADLARNRQVEMVVLVPLPEPGWYGTGCEARAGATEVD